MDYLKHRQELKEIADKVVYTGPIDAYFDYCFGNLSWRSLNFEHEIMENCDNFQGNAVINYTDIETPFTRIIEHKHFEFGQQPSTFITREYPKAWKQHDEPYYPINDKINTALYEKYKSLSQQEDNVVFGGRLAEYKYYDMDKIIANVLNNFRI